VNTPGKKRRTGLGKGEDRELSGTLAAKGIEVYQLAAQRIKEGQRAWEAKGEERE